MRAKNRRQHNKATLTIIINERDDKESRIGIVNDDFQMLTK